VTGDDDRIGYLAGEVGVPLDADDQADLEDLRRLLGDESVWAEPDPDLEDRIVSAISAEAGPAAAPARATRRRRRLVVTVASLAAAIAVAAGIAVSVGGNGAAPERFYAALASTDLAPGAAGAATLTRLDAGWQIKLHVTGLVRLDNGRFYEAWLKSPAGTLVPIGTFNQGPDVMLWAGVSPQDYPALTVTEQTANGNPASSGLRVLVGSVTTHR
jgi:hypothetical protein